MPTNALEFLQLILPTKGLYIGWVKRGEHEKIQRVFPNQFELLAWLEGLAAHGWNCYHALAGFDHMRGQPNPQTGKREHPRAEANALYYRSLFTDADSQLSHKLAVYRDQMEAFEAGLKFANDAKIPPPLPVNSGGGIHPYWPLDRDIDHALWKRLAEGLKRACIRHRFHVDHKVTANGAQVLRTPGFLHTRLQRYVAVGGLIDPYPVELFMHLLEGEEHYERTRSRRGTAQSPIQPPSLGRTLTQGLRYNPSDPTLVVRNCQQIRRIVQQPAASREPLHRIAGGVFKHCEGGTDFYVGHLDGEWKERGRDKIERWTVGPPYCGSFEAENPGGCAGCYFFDGSKEGNDRFKVTSPVHAGRFIVHSQEAPREQIRKQPDSAPAFESAEEPEQTEGAPLNGHAVNGNVYSLDLGNIKLPYPFAWWKEKPEDPHEHLVWWEKDADDPKAKPVIVSHNPIYLSAVHRSEIGEAGGNLYAFRQWLPHEGWKAIAVPAGDLWTAQGLVALSDGSANIRNPVLFKQYVQLAVDTLNDDKARSTRYEQCGWKKGPGGKRIGFLVGATMLERKERYEVVVTDELKRRSRYLGAVEGGSVRGWRNAITQLVPPHDWAGWYTILCGLGSVFISFLHPTESGPLVNNRDIGSGKGKSTRLRAVTSLWGVWDGTVILNYDTTPSAGYTRAVLNHLPCVQDELGTLMKQRDPNILPFTVNMQTEGRDKRRMESGGKKIQAQMNSFQNFMIAASNESTHDHFRVHCRGTDAHILRCQEVTSQPNTVLSPGAADRLEGELFKNGGHAGLAFLEWLLESDANMDFAETRLSYWVDYLYQHTNFEQKHRFYVRAIAAAATAGDVSKKMGNLLPCDGNWVIEQVLDEQGAKTGEKRPDEAAAAVDGEEAMGQFLAEFNQNILRVNGPYQKGTSRQEIPPHCRPHGKLVIRYEMMNERAFFAVQILRTFCIERNFSFTDIIKKLREAKFIVAYEKQVTLAAGTTLPGARVRCIEIDCKHEIMQRMPSLRPEDPDGTPTPA